MLKTEMTDLCSSSAKAVSLVVAGLTSLLSPPENLADRCHRMPLCVPSQLGVVICVRGSQAGAV
jgi:hypothetical protein